MLTEALNSDHTIIYRVDEEGNPKLYFKYQNDPEFYIHSTNTGCNWCTYKQEPWKYHGRARVFGNFIYDDENENYSHKFPTDSHIDCNRPIQPHGYEGFQNQNHTFGDARSGNLTLDLTIDKYAITPHESSMINFPTFINIMKFDLGPSHGGIRKCKLTINPSQVLDVRLDAWWTPYNNRYTQINNWGDIVLKGPYSEIWISTHNKMNMYGQSSMHLEAESFFGIGYGATFCNYGGIISGPGTVYYYNGYPTICSDLDVEFNVQDSTQVIFADSSVMVIPSNSFISIDGNITALKLRPHSKVKFGEGAKLILKNGAHIIADSAIFTSLDSNSTWDGIYLSDISNDTITNCTIENAINGINIINKTNAGGVEQPSTEITNCTFSNTTNTQLTNGIYINNSENILIKGNNFTSSQLAQGFANGVMIEYCPAGSPLVVDNNIDKVLTGMFVSQSSPFVARNTITGVSESGKGIELDNANGTFKYNVVSNFVNSFITAYSSPYLLKNTFSGASEKNIDIYCSSIPVMRPINSGTTLSWLSGNNYITGNPSTSGIGISEDSYPDIDSGFSIIDLGNSDYMSGEIPTSLDGWLFATRNYWTDEPSSQKFNVSGGDVIYDPTFDGSSYPPVDYYDLTALDFGLYDTVYVESLGDNPEADNLFMQAYQSERNHQYLQAINLYKQVITNYRSSTYAPISLSRIFNCIEKKISTNNEYLLLQTYMSNLRTNNQLNRQIREIAEDFVIKTKVKLGYLRSAINNYETMYQQNQNNHKGIHALINKEILTSMLNDTGDAPTGGNNIYAKLTNHKLKILSMITGRDFTPIKVTNNDAIPHEYKLYQNYPNPFNPKTTIKYELPKDGFISFKIYDVLGKELYSKTEFKTAGSYQINLDGTNYASGLYFYRLESGSFIQTKKMALIK